MFDNLKLNLKLLMFDNLKLNLKLLMFKIKN